jgi:hypothetical protein
MTTEILNFLSDFLKVNGVSTLIVCFAGWFLSSRFWPWLTVWLKERSAYHDAKDQRDGAAQDKLVETLANFGSSVHEQTGVLKSISTQMSQTTVYQNELINYLRRIEEKVDEVRVSRPRS